VSGAAAGLRQQLSELRRLVAEATSERSSNEAHHDDAVAWAERVSGLTLDPWQRSVLRSDDPRLGILCCRQAGKSTVVALKAGDLVRRGGLAVVVSPSLRQSSLLFRKIHTLLVAGGETFRRETASELETAGGGLALCLPGDRPDLLRGLSLRWPTTSLLIVDESARVKDAMWSTISPMLAAAPLAHQALLSTPAGASGEFHRVMTGGDRDWRRITVTADDCPRIAPGFLARERVRLGDALYRQEYACAFIVAPGSVFGADVLSAMFGDVEASDDDESPARGGLASRFVG
jgi:hypothetical protein